MYVPNWSYDYENYYSYSISLSIKETVQGESFANDCNAQQDSENSTTVFILTTVGSIITRGASKGVSDATLIVNTALDATTTFVDLSYKLQTQERVTATYTVNCSSEYEQAYGLERVTVRTKNGSIRVNDETLH